MCEFKNECIIDGVCGRELHVPTGVAQIGRRWRRCYYPKTTILLAPTQEKIHKSK